MNIQAAGMQESRPFAPINFPKKNFSGIFNSNNLLEKPFFYMVK
jgi:hypothetical protein